VRKKPNIFSSFKLKSIPKSILAVLLALWCVQANYAQDLEKLYNDSVRSRDNQKAGEGDKNKRYLEWFDAARKNGVSWKCKNYFLFYDGYVFVGDKPDGSDIGKKPFDFVGISATYRDFIKFSFPALPYENQWELNTKTSELVSYKKTLNKLEKETCQKMSE
jgi:hypothetical protein